MGLVWGSWVRSLMPKTFGEAQFINRRDADPQRYYIFGLSDVPSGEQRSHWRVMGEYLSARGQPMKAGNVDAFETPSRVQGSDHKLLAMPVEHCAALVC